jgi:enediyne biosynthesis protein CalE9
METTRRGFLKAAGGAAAATGAALALPQSAALANGRPKTVTIPDLPPSSLAEEKWWKRIRWNFSLDNGTFHYNTGTTGSLPGFGQDNLAVYEARKSANPRTFGSEFPNITARRQFMAAFIGANVDEVFLSYNCTDAMNVIYNGLAFEEGDEILTDPWQHTSENGGMQLLQQRYGVKIKVIVPPWPPTSKQAYVDAFAAGITPRTKACQFAYLPQNPALIMPAKEICAMLRSRGVASIVDGAHILGHLPLDVHDVGMDFMGMSGHKWLCGPAGTGLAYIRNSFNKDVWPLFDYYQGRTYGYGGGQVLIPRDRVPRGDYDLGAALQQYGEANTPCMFAMEDVARFWDAIGQEKIWKRLTTLSSYFKAKVADRFGAHANVMPDNPEFNSGFSYVNPFTDKYTNAKLGPFGTALTAAGVYNSGARNLRIKVGPDPSVVAYGDNVYGIRVATHFPFVGLKEIDDLVDLMDETLQAQGGPG